MSSKGAAGGLGPAPAGDNQKTLERRRSHFYSPATLWHSEVRNGEYNTMKRCLLSTPILKNWFGSFAVLILNFHDFGAWYEPGGARQEYKLEILLYLSKMSS